MSIWPRNVNRSGEKVGFYNGTRPAYGLLEWIDNFATDPRVDPWIAWKYNVDQYFLWETAFIYNKWYGEKINPWVAPYSGGSEATSRWGIGTIIYTGNDALFPEESRGIDGPIASIRLKNWRRGQQDYEYLVLAQKAGIDTRSLVDQVVPAAFDDYNDSTYIRQGQQPIWAQRGYLFEGARTAVAGRLEGAPKVELPTGSSGNSDSSRRGAARSPCSGRRRALRRRASIRELVQFPLRGPGRCRSQGARPSD